MSRIESVRRWGWRVGLVLLLAGCAPPPSAPQRVAGGAEPTHSGPLRSGDPAPDFEVTDLDGASVKLSSLDGRVRLLDFWATWCQPCRHEVPMLNELYREYAGQGLSILALSDEEPDIVREFATQEGMTYTNLVRAAEVADRYGVVGLPTAFLVDRDGKIVETYFGQKTKAPLEKRIRVLLGLDPEA